MKYKLTLILLILALTACSYAEKIDSDITIANQKKQDRAGSNC